MKAETSIRSCAFVHCWYKYALLPHLYLYPISQSGCQTDTASLQASHSVVYDNSEICSHIGGEVEL